MDCKRYEKWLTNAAIEALDPQRQRELEAHVTVCRKCRAQLERERTLLRGIDSALVQSANVELPARFAGRVKVRLAEERAAPWLPAHAWVPVTAGALALALLLAWFGPHPARLRGPASKRPEAREMALVKNQPPGVRVQKSEVRNQKSEVERLHAGMRSAHHGQHGHAVPKVLVDKNQWAAVVQLYNAIWSGRVDGASLLAKPDDDASAALKPMEIKPLEVTKLDAELRPLDQESGQ